MTLPFDCIRYPELKFASSKTTLNADLGIFPRRILISYLDDYMPSIIHVCSISVEIFPRKSVRMYLCVTVLCPFADQKYSVCERDKAGDERSPQRSTLALGNLVGRSEVSANHLLQSSVTSPGLRGPPVPGNSSLLLAGTPVVP